MKDEILAAYDRIAPLVRQTPLEHSGELGAFLKLEHLQHTGSFKFRGASNKIAMLTAEQAAAGVVTASNGNHGLGVAAAAQARGIAAEVFVSTHVSPAKARRIEAMGARIHCAGDDPLTAELAARRAAEESGRVFISPYNDLDVMAGQGTIAVELERQLPGLDAVFVAVGGGGLIGGIGRLSEGGLAADGGGGMLAGELAGDARVPAGGGDRRGGGTAHALGEYGRRPGAGLGHVRRVPPRDRPQRAGDRRTRFCARCGWCWRRSTG